MPTQAEIRAEYESNPGGYAWDWRTMNGGTEWFVGVGSPAWWTDVEYRIRPIAPTRLQSALQQPPSDADKARGIDIYQGKWRNLPNWASSNPERTPSDVQDRLVLAEGSESVEPHRADKNTGDPVNSPAHYTQGDIECVDAQRSMLTAEEFRGSCKAQALQYLWRERLKGDDQDLRKAIWWLRMAVGDDPRFERVGEIR